MCRGFMWGKGVKGCVGDQGWVCVGGCGCVCGCVCVCVWDVSVWGVCVGGAGWVWVGVWGSGNLN